MKTILLIFNLLPVLLFAQLDNSQQNIEHLKGVEFIRPGQFSQIPSYVRFEKNRLVNIANLKSWMINNFELEENIGFQLIRTEPDNLGHIHYRYQQTYHGTPIESAIWIVHTKDSKVYSMNGMIYSQISASVSTNITFDTALEKAKEFVGAEIYKWDLIGEEEHLKWESGNPEATYLPKEEMVFVTATNSFSPRDYRLAYKINIYAHEPLSRAHIYVDANSGKILRENKIIHHVDEPGTGHSVFSGEQEVIADSFEGAYRLRDGSRGDGVRTFDMNEGTDYGSAVDFIDADNDWNNVNPQKDEYAIDAHWGSEMTYDYFNLVHGRNSIDNAGFQLNSYVHYSVSFANAFWDGERMTYGDGDGADFIHPLVAIDVAAHEISHGLTTFTADLIYSGESGGLNESFSDIFGSTVERYARPDEWSWLIGEDLGFPIRSMSNPNDFDDPDTYLGDFWTDGADVHILSGVQNHWYYLLTDGGTGTNDIGDAFDVTGLGLEASAAIAFRNLTVYLTPSSDYAEARFYAIQSAVDLYGGCTFEVEQTTNAWYAVGVGIQYSPEVIASFSPSSDEGCEVPFTVTFSNTSLNGVDYVWDFGDGSTSTETSPTHTYTTEGTFDVSLSADGGDCGEHDTLYTDAILIDTDLNCPVILPPTGTASTQTACEGVIFDSGGAADGYGDSESSQVTISPDGAATVELTFVTFDVEFSPGCIYDYLTIYDGPDDSSPVIGVYCNADTPPASIISTGPSITIAFVSDFVESFAGFEIEWTCNEEVDDTGLNEKTENIISIYPNPTNGELIIKTNNLTNGSIEITDLLGRTLIQLPIQENLTHYNFAKYNATGIYMVKIRDNQGNLLKVEKVILN
jgi:bacillolysin